METFQNAYELGQFVRRQRTSGSITQADLAKQSAVSRDWLVRFENGASGQELSKVISVLRSLGLSLSTAPTPAVVRNQIIDSIFDNLRKD